MVAVIRYMAMVGEWELQSGWYGFGAEWPVQGL
jgi:hypothetical protein